MTWLENDWVEKKPLPTYRQLDPSDARGGYINSSGRPSGTKVDAIVLHYTAGGHYINSSWKWFAMPEAQVSAHFLVGRKGEVLQCLPTSVKAWHAGRSSMLDITTHREQLDANGFSVGIEIANFGYLVKKGDEYYLERGVGLKRYKRELYGEPVLSTQRYGGDGSPEFTAYWEPFPDVQVEAVIQLCKALVGTGIPANRIVGHQDVIIPIQHKRDPGPLWPWDRLEADLGVTFPSRKVW